MHGWIYGLHDGLLTDLEHHRVEPGYGHFELCGGDCLCCRVRLRRDTAKLAVMRASDASSPDGEPLCIKFDVAGENVEHLLSVGYAQCNAAPRSDTIAVTPALSRACRSLPAPRCARASVFVRVDQTMHIVGQPTETRISRTWL